MFCVRNITGISGLALPVCLYGFVAYLLAGEKDAPQPLPVKESTSVTFEKDVAPIFAAKRQQCHGEKAQKSELDLRTAQSLAKGGASGDVIVPHKPEEDPLYEYTTMATS